MFKRKQERKRTTTPVVSDSSSTKKPLALKQRTSSEDNRRDYNVSSKTWTSLLQLLKPREYFITVDHFSIWRRHLLFANTDGTSLREHVTKRYASSMVFMSLLLSTELSVLFNSAGVTTQMRKALTSESYGTLSFWAGIAIIMSAVLAVFSLISIFTVWTMVSALNPVNAHCVLRSAIGQHVNELPGKFIVGSIYSFLLWLMMFFFLLLPPGFSSFLLLALVLVLFVYTIKTLSVFGRIIMHTGAMGPHRIFDEDFESDLLPHGLNRNLLKKARVNLAIGTSISRQYRTQTTPIDCELSEEELFVFLNGSGSANYALNLAEPRRTRNRAQSSVVRFADGFNTSGGRLWSSPQQRTKKDNNGAAVDGMKEEEPSSMSALSSSGTTSSPRGGRPARERAHTSTDLNDPNDDSLRSVVVSKYTLGELIEDDRIASADDDDESIKNYSPHGDHVVVGSSKSPTRTTNFDDENGGTNPAAAAAAARQEKGKALIDELLAMKWVSGNKISSSPRRNGSKSPSSSSSSSSSSEIHSAALRAPDAESGEVRGGGGEGEIFDLESAVGNNHARTSTPEDASERLALLSSDEKKNNGGTYSSFSGHDEA